MNTNKLITDNMGICAAVIKKLKIRANNYDDAYGEAQLALVKAAQTYDESKGKFPTWAWIQVEGALLHWMHKERRYREVLSGHVPEQTPVLDNSEAYDYKVDEASVQQAIQVLDPTMRDMANMLLVKGYTLRECATALGVCDSTAIRYRKKLKTALDPVLEKLSASPPNESSR